MTSRLRRNIPLTHERVRELLDYNPETGVLSVAKKRRRSQKKGDPLGSLIPASGYVRLALDGNHYYAHRIIWFWMTGKWPSPMVDHRNGNRSDNRWANLREVTPTENARNRAPRNSSGILGVYRTRFGTWQAQICTNGKRVALGTYKSISEAAQARRAGEREYWGEYSRASSLQTVEVRHAA